MVKSHISCTLTIERWQTIDIKREIINVTTEWELLSGDDKLTLNLLGAQLAVDSLKIYKEISVNIPKSALWVDNNDL